MGHSLIDPSTKKVIFFFSQFHSGDHFHALQQPPCYVVMWITQGEGTAVINAVEYAFRAPCLVCFSPYERFRISAGSVLQGTTVHFYPDFFCIHRQREMVRTHGILFNNLYQSPVIDTSEAVIHKLNAVLARLAQEMKLSPLPKKELFVSYLKVILIVAARCRLGQHDVPPLLTKAIQRARIFQDYLEKHFRSKHMPGQYARLVHVSTETLAKVLREQFGKTTHRLIADRIVLEAKQELCLTGKRIKDIAVELGFPDEYYFSRFFKKNVSVSPRVYRLTVAAGQFKKK